MELWMSIFLRNAIELSFILTVIQSAEFMWNGKTESWPKCLPFILVLVLIAVARVYPGGFGHEAGYPLFLESIHLYLPLFERSEKATAAWGGHADRFLAGTTNHYPSATMHPLSKFKKKSFYTKKKTTQNVPFCIVYCISLLNCVLSLRLIHPAPLSPAPNFYRLQLEGETTLKVLFFVN